MTTRRFHHSYEPAGLGTHGLNPIELTTAEIADAAMREISQLSLRSMPFDLLLEELLVPHDRWFRWISQLGQIRETKTALSGLFGRFVARAYLTRYLHFNYFEPIKSDTQSLAMWPTFNVRRNASGDLPDWIVASAGGANSIAVAEAKGSHNRAGPWAPLNSAINQANRIDVVTGHATLQIKRYAIASRWAVDSDPNLTEPWLAVKDPVSGERPPTAEENDLLVRGVALGHFAAFADGFGQSSIAKAIREAKSSQPGKLEIPSDGIALITRDASPEIPVIGAFVTPSGIIPFPKAADIQEYSRNVDNVFDGRSMVFYFDIKSILRADNIASPFDTDLPIDVALTPKVDFSKDFNFWDSPRRSSDGGELFPTRQVTLRKQPPDASSKT